MTSTVLEPYFINSCLVYLLTTHEIKINCSPISFTMIYNFLLMLMFQMNLKVFWKNYYKSKFKTGTKAYNKLFHILGWKISILNQWFKSHSNLPTKLICLDITSMTLTLQNKKKKLLKILSINSPFQISKIWNFLISFINQNKFLIWNQSFLSINSKDYSWDLPTIMSESSLLNRIIQGM